MYFFLSRRFRRQDVRHGNAAQQCFGQQFIGNLLTPLQTVSKCLTQKVQILPKGKRLYVVIFNQIKDI